MAIHCERQRREGEILSVKHTFILPKIRTDLDVSKVPHLGLADGVEEGEELGSAEGVNVHCPQGTLQAQGQLLITS